MSRRFCPNCGSEDVEPDTRRTNVLGEFIFNQNKWVCNQCDYTGLMPTGEPDEGTDFEEVEQEKIDTDAGRGYFKFFLYVELPALILSVIIILILLY